MFFFFLNFLACFKVPSFLFFFACNIANFSVLTNFSNNSCVLFAPLKKTAFCVQEKGLFNGKKNYRSFKQQQKKTGKKDFDKTVF